MNFEEVSNFLDVVPFWFTATPGLGETFIQLAFLAG
jgi:hypothetical protein